MNIAPGNPPTDLAAYEQNGGYEAVRNTIGKTDPSDVLEVVKDSNLRGRGGAGFPTGTKWSFVPMDKTTGHKYLIANADEMEPGTFKDRVIMENDPHQLIEGMILAAWTIAADIGYIFIRHEYHLATARLRQAIEEARAKNYLGQNILGSGYNFELFVHSSAGRYICGEETALLNSLEGRRAIPRAKPPFPQVSGLWGRPTIVNNVETLCNVTHIVRNGADWFKSLGIGEDSGTKLFGVRGRVNNPGCWELPMGTPIREILEEHAGGMKDGYRLKGFLPGGGSTDFLTAEHLDLSMDYDVIGKAGSRMGTGTMIILDDRTCPVGMVANLEMFFARESCGFCTPCREGLPWVYKVLKGIEDGQGRPEDLEALESQSRFIGAIGNTHCAHAPGAIEPLSSAMNYFRDEFEQHIEQKRCPYE
ncbi:MAG: NADH-quinone oxidoreductase subunit NuoF [Pseudomonadales bacterium]|nr:NADH-quinone oxidoreductase subunit NuoF [Pseudomonadales bacterium]